MQWDASGGFACHFALASPWRGPRRRAARETHKLAVGLIDRTFALFFFALAIGIGLMLGVATLLLDQAAGGCPACGSTCADARTGAR